MANILRNQCDLVYGGETFTVKATLNLLEAYESRYTGTDWEKARSTTVFRIAGLLISHADDATMTEEEAAEFAYQKSNQAECLNNMVEFLKVAYKNGDDEKPGKSKKPAAK